MKRIIYLLFLVSAGVVLLESFGEGALGKRRDGTDPGYTGSPGDSLRNCTVCHGGSAVTVEGWITSNIPAEGYTPGQRYTIRAVNTEGGHNRFGFSISPQHPDGRLLGTMVITDSVKTKLIGNDKYITYRSGGVDSKDSMVWVFDWIAPPAGTRDVIFFGAFNSNEDGHKGQDVTKLSTLRVREVGTTGMDNENQKLTFSVYPNPAQHFLKVYTGTVNNSKVEITDMNGKLVTTAFLENTNEFVLSTEKLPEGLYFLKVNAGSQSGVSKLYISR